MNKLGTFFKLIKLFWNNGDHLMKLMNILESQLPHVGQALEDAGQMAILSSQVLTGSPGAAQVIEAASVAVDDCGKKFRDASAEIGRIRIELHDLNLPSVTIEEKEYPVLFGAGHVKIPTPTKSDWYPFRDIENYLAEQKSLIEDASSKLTTAKQELHLLSGKIAEAGNHIRETGADLKEAGRLLKDI